MKRNVITAFAIVASAAALVYALTLTGGEKWDGVDETVVEKYAVQAGHPPRHPLINTDKGDLLLFFFLVAGTCAGFLAGITFKEVFPDVQPTEPSCLIRAPHA